MSSVAVFVIEDDESNDETPATRPDASRCTADEERHACPCCRVLRMGFGCAMM